jgi:hypothetical protein
MRSRARTGALLIASSTLVACAAVLGLPDPTLDDASGPGDPSGEASADGSLTGEASAADAGAEASGRDANVDAGACDHAAPWSIVRLDALASSGDDDMPSLTADEQTIYFRRGPADGQGGQIMVAQRTDGGIGFANPAPVAIAPNGGAVAPCVTGDGTLLYYSRLQGGQTFNIVSKTLPGGPEQVEQGLLAGEPRFCGSFAADGSMTLWQQSPTTNIATYLRASRIGSTLQKPEPVPGFASSATTFGARPVVSSDQLTIFYQATGTAAAGPDIYTADRLTTAAPFTNHTVVPGLSSPAFDTPGWLSLDGCRMYFSSTRQGGAGGHDLYLASRGGKGQPQ